jgi:hypothetical protein
VVQKFGNYVEREEGTGEYLKIGFHPTSIPLQQRWRNNGLSADFLAGYVSTFFPGKDPISTERQIEIRDAISYIANELLENAMKFSYGSSRHTVSIEMFLEADVISLYSVNCLEPDKLESFQQFIQRLLTEDPRELYIAQLERNAEDDNDGVSSLGFLTMLNDYGATVAWKFSGGSQGEDAAAVTTMVQFAV